MSLTASPIATLTVKKGASAASVSFKRYGDGTLEFTDVGGKIVRESGSNTVLRKLFDKISSLV